MRCTRVDTGVVESGILFVARTYDLFGEDVVGYVAQSNKGNQTVISEFDGVGGETSVTLLDDLL